MSQEEFLGPDPHKDSPREYPDDIPPEIIAVDRLHHMDFVGVLGEEGAEKFSEFLYRQLAHSRRLGQVAIRANIRPENDEPLYVWLEYRIVKGRRRHTLLESTMIYVPQSENDLEIPEELESVPIYELPHSLSVAED